MFDGVMLDVAIGLLLVFLVSSLIASAAVEAIGGFFHRRAKHLWDTLDLLLGNTSVDDGERSLVDELYRTPFITGLVRPTARARFDPASGEQRNGKVPLRAAPPQALANAAVVDTRATDAQQQLRRYYGPIHIDPHEFTNGLLAALRPEGKLDQSLAVLRAIRAQLDDQSGTDIAIGDVDELLDELRSAATSIRAGEVTDAIDALRSGGERVDIDNVRDVVADAEAALLGFFTGDPTREQLVAALDVVPRDLRVKLLAVLDEAGDEIVSIRAGIEKWYERTMDAASTWYRKQTRWFLFVAGLVMAVSMNIDAVGAATTLYRDETTREAVVALAYQVNDVTCVEDVDAADGDTAAPPDLDCVRDSVGGSLPLPVGWDEVDTSATGWVLRVIGWILVAGAVTVGAPFWFDLLGRALRHRSRDSKG
jgi:hypothetical protein